MTPFGTNCASSLTLCSSHSDEQTGTAALNNRLQEGARECLEQAREREKARHTHTHTYKRHKQLAKLSRHATTEESFGAVLLILLASLAENST